MQIRLNRVFDRAATLLTARRVLAGARCLPPAPPSSRSSSWHPMADYKLYVSESCTKLVTDTRAFTDAVKAGDVAKAKALFAPTRVHYEEIEPIAELFSDLDASMDSRADDHEQAEKDPGFTGFHRIEYGLFALNSTDGLAPYADKLMADVNELQKRIAAPDLPAGQGWSAAPRR